MVLLTEVVRRFFCPFSRQFSLPFPWRFYAPPPSFVLGRVGAEDCCFVFSACVRIFVSVSLVIAYRVVRLSNVAVGCTYMLLCSIAGRVRKKVRGSDLIWTSRGCRVWVHGGMSICRQKQLLSLISKTELDSDLVNKRTTL